MDCKQARLAISALSDHEDPGVSLAALGVHLDRCATCAAWQQAALCRSRIGLFDDEPGDDVLVGAMRSLAVERAAQHEAQADRAIRPWRVGLVVVAVIQPLLVLSSLLSKHWLHHIHSGRELGAWHLALAVGFLFAAWRPSRAWGMLPLVVAMVTGVLITSGVDLADGHVRFSDELTHVLDVAGLACLWALSVRVARPVFQLRAA